MFLLFVFTVARVCLFLLIPAALVFFFFCRYCLLKPIFLLVLTKLQVTYTNVILPLAELQAQQFPLIQSCMLPKLVSTREDVRKASAEAERRIDAHLDICRFASIFSCTICDFCPHVLLMGLSLKLMKCFILALVAKFAGLTEKRQYG